MSTLEAIKRHIPLLLTEFRAVVCVFFLLLTSSVDAQYNVDRLILSGKVAMHYEDYVLSIQYFNQAINQKPFLWEPWHLRAVSKYYLEDWVGSEADETKAIELNPYITGLYDLRGISRINQGKFSDAIDDYSKAIKLEPQNKGFWYNRAVCYMESKDYHKANEQFDSIIAKWSDYAPTYLIKAENYLHLKDTANAVTWVDKCLSIDKHHAEAWRMKAYISMSQQKWEQSEEAFGKALHYKPKDIGCYVNRAAVRLHINNLRGAMADYDMALELAPNNFLAHYNRGLLRMQVGDNNRAIEDFDYVLSLEPGNIMALFNRATLLDKTGDLRGAVRDYSIVIEKFPNFWTGLQYRASCYRRMGMVGKAQQDEFRIFKAQMDKHLGVQHRWSRSKLTAMRKLNDIDIEKYDQLVMEDSQETLHDYKSEYRGKVQNRNVEETFQPYIALSLAMQENGVAKYTPYDNNMDMYLDSLKNMGVLRGMNLPRLCGVGEGTGTLSFEQIDKISESLDGVSNDVDKCLLLILRSIAYSSAQNYQDAIRDLDDALSFNKNNIVAMWQKSVCNALMMEYEQSISVKDTKMRVAGVVSDFERLKEKDSNDALLYYNHGTFLARTGNYKEASQLLSMAIENDASLPYAYYNRGLVYIKLSDFENAKKDFGKAGELGLYGAYSLMKKIKK